MGAVPASTLTQNPLPLLGRREVEDIGLFARVGPVIGLNLDGELLHEGAGVSGRRERWGNRGVKMGSFCPAPALTSPTPTLLQPLPQPHPPPSLPHSPQTPPPGACTSPTPSFSLGLAHPTSHPLGPSVRHEVGPHSAAGCPLLCAGPLALQGTLGWLQDECSRPTTQQGQGDRARRQPPEHCFQCSSAACPPPCMPLSWPHTPCCRSPTPCHAAPGACVGIGIP